MRDTIENISLLQKQLNDLQLENQVLKNILDQSGISYMLNDLRHINRLDMMSAEESTVKSRQLMRSTTASLSSLFFRKICWRPGRRS